MSDSSSNGSFPGGFEYANHRLSDYPLFPTSLPSESLTAADRRQVHLASASVRLRELRLRRAQREFESALLNQEDSAVPDFLHTLEALRADPPRPFDSAPQFGRVPGNANLMPPVLPSSQIERGPKQLVLTCANALPPTTYNEQDEPDSTQNTLAYVKVQRALLKYTETRPTDSLSPRQACLWTQAIDPAGKKEPKAVDALRLCYYMRSQGYDVYSRVASGHIWLYVVHQGSHVRDALRDALYWKQNVLTNRIAFFATPATGASRRNAVPAPRNSSEYEGLIASLIRQDAAQAAAAAIAPAPAPAIAPAPAPAIAPAPAPVPPTPPTAVQTALHAAQDALQTELDREESDPVALSAAVQALEALLQDP